MAINPYHNIVASTDFQVYDFVSIGNKTIKKRVKFDLIDETELIYNLALCTIFDDDHEDCITASRNGDMMKVLETVGPLH
jgi:hypothetical protein